METVTTAILDKFPNLRQCKLWVVLSVAVFGYLGGLGFTTNSGMYWLQLMDKYAAAPSVIIAIIECILVAWCYGSERFIGDIQGMIGRRSRLWVFFWSWMWKIVTPATLLVSPSTKKKKNDAQFILFSLAVYPIFQLVRIQASLIRPLHLSYVGKCSWLDHWNTATSGCDIYRSSTNAWCSKAINILCGK